MTVSTISDPILGRRKAGAASAALLALSALASFGGFVAYGAQRPVFPAPATLILGVVTLPALAAAAWLGRAIWRDGARWPAAVLFGWAFLKQVVPHILYPDALPRIIYLVAGFCALHALIRSRTKA